MAAGPFEPPLRTVLLDAVQSKTHRSLTDTLVGPCSVVP